MANMKSSMSPVSSGTNATDSTTASPARPDEIKTTTAPSNANTEETSPGSTSQFKDIRFKGELGKRKPDALAVATNEKNWDEKIKNFHSEFEIICRQQIGSVDPKEFPFAEMVAEALFGLSAYSVNDSNAETKGVLELEADNAGNGGTSSTDTIGDSTKDDDISALTSDIPIFAQPEIMYVPEEILVFCPEKAKLRRETDLSDEFKQKRESLLGVLASKKKALANSGEKETSMSNSEKQYALRGRLAVDQLTKETESGKSAHDISNSEPSWPLALSRLHLTPEGQFAQFKPPRSGHDPFRRRWAKSLHDKKFRKKVFTLFRRFVTKIGKQHFGDLFDKAQKINSPEEDDSTNTSVYFQIEPSLRIHMPEVRPQGVPHCDADYFHQRGEVNFWWPVVHETFDSNSLYCESVRNKEDFAPFNLKYGEYMRFYGNQARHFTVPNVSDITRVSLDIRVVPGPLFIEKWSSTSNILVVPFTAGGYYKKLDIYGENNTGAREKPYQ